MDEKDLLHPETYRDRISTVTETNSRKWVYALQPNGKFYNFRSILAYLYVAAFFIMPFIKLNGMPFLMLNIVSGKFIIFGKIFWPQDFFIFAVGMITFIVFIALFTVIYGRLFCGWACPQTIFMEFIFRKIEWWIEGSPSQQRARDKADWDSTKLMRKVLKHVIFFSVSFLIANTFLSYILGTDELFKIISEPISEHITLLSGLLIFTFLFYAVFAFVRDIVCTTICPYGRLQGVLFDKDTMQIAYDYGRGEPRGKLRKSAERKEGDCIDCKKCVQVCPTGIDIRDGLQMECVGCTACIDACDEVMDKIGFPKGLIRYASENEISTKRKFHFNNRMKAYTALLVALTVFMGVLVMTRKTIDMNISRVKGQLFQETPDHKISNLFNAKIINKTNREIPLQFKLENIEGTVKIIGSHEFFLKKEAISEAILFIEIPKEAIKQRSTQVKLGLYEGAKRVGTKEVRFIGSE